MDDDAARRARFEHLARDVWAPLHAYVARRAPRSEVDDIVSETLTTLWRRLDDVPADATLPWTSPSPGGRWPTSAAATVAARDRRRAGHLGQHRERTAVASATAPARIAGCAS